MSSKAPTPPAVEHARDQLGDEFARVALADQNTSASPRRARPLAFGLAGLILLAGVGAVLIPGTDEVLPGTDRALAITSDGDSVTVEVVDATAKPEQMTAELQEAGIDGSVLSIPVSDDNVGEWAMISGGAAAGASGHPDFNSQLNRHPEFVTIPKGASGIVLVAGRSAKDGEAVNVLPDGGTLPEPVE